MKEYLATRFFSHDFLSLSREEKRYGNISQSNKCTRGGFSKLAILSKLYWFVHACISKYSNKYAYVWILV